MTCGDCQREFVLSDIVKFIQHKVSRCNKDGAFLGDTCRDDELHDPDEDEDDPYKSPVFGAAMGATEGDGVKAVGEASGDNGIDDRPLQNGAGTSSTPTNKSTTPQPSTQTSDPVGASSVPAPVTVSPVAVLPGASLSSPLGSLSTSSLGAASSLLASIISSHRTSISAPISSSAKPNNKDGDDTIVPQTNCTVDNQNNDTTLNDKTTQGNNTTAAAAGDDHDDVTVLENGIHDSNKDKKDGDAAAQSSTTQPGKGQY